MLFTFLRRLFIASRSIQDADMQNKNVGTAERITAFRSCAQTMLVECCFADGHGSIDSPVVKRNQNGKQYNVGQGEYVFVTLSEY
jgi:hypothetical protein